MSSHKPNLSWRYGAIILLLFGAGMINYVDRQTLSVLKPLVKENLAIDDEKYALLVNIFTFCYAGAYIVTGWLVDRIGPRLALFWFITLWSLATIGCGLSDTFVAFAVFRALLGLAEPGNQPVAVKALTLWVPVERRGLIMSLVGGGSTAGSIVAAPLVAWLATRFGWHAAFIVPGVIGLGIGLVWWFVYRNPPPRADAPAPTAAPSASAAPALRWSQLWRTKSLWGIVLARFVSDPVWYYCLFWMPGYFQEQRGLSLIESGRIGWIPFAAASLGGISIAAYSDRLGRKLGDPWRARVRLLLVLACLGPLCMAVPHVPSLAVTVALLCVIAVVCLGWLSLLGPLVADTFPAGNVGSVWSIAGAFGALGAIIFNHQVGQITTALGSEKMFLILGLLHLLAAAILVSLVRKIPPPRA
ncbi:MAG TPA: MFS transporter [Lacunisphaera sp.]|nr:MFS transporter [Lacunisphaera sp.]